MTKFLSIINSNSVVILNRFGDIGHWKYVTWIDLSRSLEVKDNGSKWIPHYGTYMTSYPSPIVIFWLSWIDLDIDHWKPVWPGLTFQGHSRSKKTAKWNFIHDFLYVNNGNWPLILHNFRDISQNSVMGVKTKIWPPCRHFLDQTENKWAYMLALLSFISAPSLTEIQLVLFELRLQVCLHPRWPPGRHCEYQKSICIILRSWKKRFL